MKLKNLRKTLFQTNQELIFLYKKRSQVVSHIQSEKSSLSIPRYLPQQEWQYYCQNKTLFDGLTQLELLSFSLLMESHVGESYPSWYRKEHISQNIKELDTWERINPLLVRLVAPKIEKQLKYHQVIENRLRF